MKVIGKTSDSLTLRLRIISAEQPDFFDSKSFALMLLYDPIVSERVKGAALGEHVTFENTIDPAWLKTHAGNYIRSSRLHDITNHPLTIDLVALSPKRRRDFWKSSNVPQSTLEIVVTEPRWIAHVEKGDEWETAAYDATF